jgi:hypothetical protein
VWLLEFESEFERHVGLSLAFKWKYETRVWVRVWVWDEAREGIRKGCNGRKVCFEKNGSGVVKTSQESSVVVNCTSRCDVV